MNLKDFDWKRTLATVAPVLASALGSPMAGVAVKMATDALGFNNGSEDDLAMAVASGDPQVLATLKQVDNEFKLEMKRLDVEIQKLDVKDRASARAMGVAKGFMPQVVLSSIFVCGFIYVLGVLFQGESVNESMMEPAMYVLGILSAGIIQIMNFWFGSSSGSKDKTKAMTMIAENGAR